MERAADDVEPTVVRRTAPEDERLHAAARDDAGASSRSTRRTAAGTTLGAVP